MPPFPIIRARRLLPAVTSLESPADAVELANAFLAGGLEVMEITLRHPAALDCIAAITAQVPAMCCGAGTILHADQVTAAIAAGAKFGVAPGFHPANVLAARAEQWPFIPGIATPGELEQAMDLGCELVKFFPCEALGGVAFLTAIAGPYAHTGVGIVPMGGIREDNLDSYLAIPLVAAVGMSALSPLDAIRAGDWPAITATTRRLLQRAASLAERAEAEVAVGHRPVVALQAQGAGRLLGQPDTGRP